jgi:hypothetical protein
MPPPRPAGCTSCSRWLGLGAFLPLTGQGGDSLLITCAGHTVPWDFSLAAVRQWIWRRSDDLVLHFSVRNHGTPLKLPAIRPPALLSWLAGWQAALAGPVVAFVLLQSADSNCTQV